MKKKLLFVALWALILINNWSSVKYGYNLLTIDSKIEIVESEQINPIEALKENGFNNSTVILNHGGTKEYFFNLDFEKLDSSNQNLIFMSLTPNKGDWVNALCEKNAIGKHILMPNEFVNSLTNLQRTTKQNGHTIWSLPVGFFIDSNYIITDTIYHRVF
jgi:hypothetical protein